MGNNNQPSYQDTYKICMICNANNKLNKDLMVLNITTNANVYKGEYGKELLLRCSNGHIFKYSGPEKHIDYCSNYLNQIESKNNIKNEESIKEIQKLKNEIDLLKKQIEKFKINNDDNDSDNNNDKNIIPSAPPEQKNNIESNKFNLDNIQIVEAQLIE